MLGATIIIAILLTAFPCFAGEPETSSCPSASEEGLIVREFHPRYLNAESLIAPVKAVLGSGGEVAFIRERNSLVVKDTAFVVGRVEGLLSSVDKKPVRIVIEGRIVEIENVFGSQYGINWQAGHSADTVFGRLGRIGSDFSINLPQGGLSGTPTEAGMLGVGLAVDGFTLDLRLSALEDSGEAKILSKPRIMVLENQEATITSGEELVVPVSETVSIISKSGDKDEKPVVFDAKLQLKVTPRIIGGDFISFDVFVKREEFDFGKEIKGYPSKYTKSASTNLLVKDGETIAIGGIYTQNEYTRERAVPIFSKIPLIGRLFKRHDKGASRKELLVFLTPTIMKEDK